MKITLFASLLLLTGLLLGDLYRPPNMEKDIFNTEKLEIHPVDRATLFTGLLFIARDFDEEEDEVDFELRAHALAIAGRLYPKEERFTDVHEDLKARSQTVMEDETEISEASRKIFKGIKALMQEKDNKDNLKCAAYCIDVALRLDPENRFADELKDFKKVAGKADWDDMLGEAVAPSNGDMWDIIFGRNQQNFEERSEVVPGGKAEKFAATQRSIYGLWVKTLSNGRMAGGSSSLSATALPDADTDGIEFHIDQKVGEMTGNSLEEIAKLMYVRHEPEGRLPSGFKVEIAFEDKDTPLDGPSAGTAMSIILDSLFTGRELDDSFAVTGGMTADAKVTRIGGVSGKIRGATNKGCKLVGVPHENIKGVSDILVLDGIEKLMNIQVFSFKTLEDALLVASKDKEDYVQQTIDDFNAVVEVIKEQGEKTLTNPNVIKKLENIVEAMPNHESARILLTLAKKEEKKVLSVNGSFHQIRVNFSGAIESLRKVMNGGTITSADLAQAKDAVVEMEEMVSKLDPRLKEYSEAMLEIAKALAKGPEVGEEVEDFGKDIKKLWDIAQTEEKKCKEDPEIVEEM